MIKEIVNMKRTLEILKNTIFHTGMTPIIRLERFRTFFNITLTVFVLKKNVLFFTLFLNVIVKSMLGNVFIV